MQHPRHAALGREDHPTMRKSDADGSASAVDDTADRCELQTAKRELKALRAQLENVAAALDMRNAALDAATTHFMIMDVRQTPGVIVYANRALALLHGYEDPRELIGRDVTAISSKVMPDEAREALWRNMQGRRETRMESEIVRGDGSRLLVGFTAAPLFDALGGLTHIVIIGADITARRAGEIKQRELQEQLVAQMQERERMAIELQLAQKLESVGRLAAGLAHEINTPIQYVGDSIHFLKSAFVDLSRFIDSCRRDLIPPAQAQGLRELEVGCDLEFLRQEIPNAFERTLEGTARVTNLVRAMKEFAYPDAPEHVPADLNRAIETTIAVARNEYKYAATLTTRLGELPPVLCNVGELNQVFLNLIVNAAHAVEDAGKDAVNGRIEIETRADGEMAQISIADNGCGIPAANLAKIFDPFYTTKEVGRGTGQGLAIARSIVVDRHGGEVDVQSSPGVGTTFTVRLPVRGSAVRSAASLILA
jgi:PAS domain S-box-containing protein